MMNDKKPPRLPLLAPLPLKPGPDPQGPNAAPPLALSLSLQTRDHFAQGGSVAPFWRRHLPVVDAAVAAALKGPIACQKGCAHCCRQDVAVSPIEVFNLLGYLRATLSRAAYAALFVEVQARAAQIQETGAGVARAAARIPCGLLDEPTQTCRVYAHRPLACRAYHSLSELACREPNGLHAYYAGTAALHNLPAFVGLGLEDGHLDGRPVELTQALSLVMESSGAEATWRSGADLFARAAALNTERWSQVRQVRRQTVWRGREADGLVATAQAMETEKG